MMAQGNVSDSDEIRCLATMAGESIFKISMLTATGSVSSHDVEGKSCDHGPPSDLLLCRSQALVTRINFKYLPHVENENYGPLGSLLWFAISSHNGAVDSHALFNSSSYFFAISSTLRALLNICYVH